MNFSQLSYNNQLKNQQLDMPICNCCSCNSSFCTCQCLCPCHQKNLSNINFENKNNSIFLNDNKNTNEKNYPSYHSINNNKRNNNNNDLNGYEELNLLKNKLFKEKKKLDNFQLL